MITKRNWSRRVDLATITEARGVGARGWGPHGRIQDFLIGGEPNILEYRGRGTNERSELRAKRV